MAQPTGDHGKGLMLGHNDLTIMIIILTFFSFSLSL